MSVGLLIVTHEHIGGNLLDTATQLLGVCPLPGEAIQVPLDCDPDAIFAIVQESANRLDTGSGVLVLTDMYGSTPSNVANRLVNRPETRVVSGVNLPMLIRILNYPRLSVDELMEKAISGGRDGVLMCRGEPGH